jgi:hypothetical protein
VAARWAPSRWGCGRDRLGRVCGKSDRAEAYPDLNDDRKEFKDVDVYCLGIDFRFMEVVLIVPTHVPSKACGNHIGDCDPPHVVELVFTRPAAQRFCGGVGKDCDGRESFDQETDRSTPKGIVEIHCNFCAQITEFSEDGGIQTYLFSLVPPAQGFVTWRFDKKVVEGELQSEGSLSAHWCYWGGMPQEAEKTTDAVRGASLIVVGGREEFLQEDDQFLALRERPCHDHLSCVDEISQELHAMRDMFCPLVRVDAWWSMRIFFRAAV